MLTVSHRLSSQPSVVRVAVEVFFSAVLCANTRCVLLLQPLCVIRSAETV